MTAESDSIDALKTMLEGRLDTLDVSVDALTTAVNGVKTSIDAVDGDLDTLNTNITTLNTNLVNLKTSVDDVDTTLSANLSTFTTAFGVLGPNDPFVDNIQAAKNALEMIRDDIDVLSNAFGSAVTQSFVQNIQDIRNDTREGLELSLQQLERAGISTKISRQRRT